MNIIDRLARRRAKILSLASILALVGCGGIGEPKKAAPAPKKAETALIATESVTYVSNGARRIDAVIGCQTFENEKFVPISLKIEEIDLSADGASESKAPEAMDLREAVLEKRSNVFHVNKDDWPLTQKNEIGYWVWCGETKRWVEDKIISGKEVNIALFAKVPQKAGVEARGFDYFVLEKESGAPVRIRVISQLCQWDKIPLKIPDFNEFKPDLLPQKSVFYVAGRYSDVGRNVEGGYFIDKIASPTNVLKFTVR